MVIKGGWKGFEGFVKDADDKSVRMELSAKAKVITVQRDCVKLKTDLTENENENDAGARLDQSIFFLLNGLLMNFVVGKTPIHPGMRSNAFNPASPFQAQSPAWG